MARPHFALMISLDHARLQKIRIETRMYVSDASCFDDLYWEGGGLL